MNLISESCGFLFCQFSLQPLLYGLQLFTFYAIMYKTFRKTKDNLEQKTKKGGACYTNLVSKSKKKGEKNYV